MTEKLELRMYGLVPYNISPIQQGIQFGHAVVEYANEFNNDSDYINWAINYKTFIILNGGTTNTSLKNYGTLNTHRDTLIEEDIKCVEFCEPDLGDQLTAIVFLVDERVFNKNVYPDFRPWLENILGSEIVSKTIKLIKKKKPNATIEDIYSKEYNEWIELIGGEKNKFLREFLRDFRKA